MKILIVCSVNSGRIMPFITEQGDEMTRQGNAVDYFTIEGKGILGYLNNYKSLKNQIAKNKYDIVHAHYGLSGALAVIQRKVPVVITFHNGETLTKKGNLIASVGSLFSAYNIYVAQHIYELCYFKRKKKSLILPCGIDLEGIEVISKEKAIRDMNLPTDKVNIVFGGAFVNLRKNLMLAQKAISLMKDIDVNLIELKGYSRKQVTALLCGCDLMLLPTKSEGSPQIVKEAMACNCPIVATNVADIKVLMGNTAGCYLTSFEPLDVVNKIEQAIHYGKRTAGRKLMNNYDNKIIVERIVDIYKKVIAD